MPLSDCTTYYWREMKLRMEHWNERPPWEDAPGYQWTGDAIGFQLHKTADPGEAGGFTTTPADYAGYVGPIVYGRTAAAWQLSGAGTANPKMVPTAEIGFGTASAVQQIHAVSLGMRVGGTWYGMGRDAITPFDTESGKYPALPIGACEDRIR